MKAIWNDTVIAESDDIIVFEGDHYFPMASVRQDALLSSNRRTMCSVKGECRYHTLFVDGNAAPDAAWFIPDPREAAESLRGRIAFAREVSINA